MSIAGSLLPEFDAEMAGTRRVLERIPDPCPDWKPHRKSMTFNRLATLVAEMPQWTVGMLGDGRHDIPADYAPMVLQRRQEILGVFDTNVAQARKTIEAAPDPTFDKTWSLTWGGRTVFSMPMTVAYRQMLMNHLVHHRAQLTVYLRMNDIPVPGLYGDSADEH